jgi:LmbE family N-acetylglucosaminyl deacetylase
VSTAAKAQAGRDRARESRLKAARERRRQLDPQQLAREQRIDEATVDVEMAWEARAEAERAMEAAEVAAGTAVERLLGERLSVTDVVELTGLGQSTVRRIRQTVSPREQPRGGETGPR